MCIVSFSKDSSYVALDKLSASWPSWAYITITSSCNMNCAGCYGEYSNVDPKFMTLETYEMVLNKLLSIGINQVSISGGEPLLHEDFFKFVEMARALDFKVNVLTYGNLLTSTIITKLKKLGVNQVQINWTGKNHSESDVYDKQVEAIKLLKKAGIKVVTTTILYDTNVPDIANIILEAGELDVDRIRVWEATGVGKSLFNFDLDITLVGITKMASDLGYSHVLSYEPDYIVEDSVPCLQKSGMTMFINHDGKLTSCAAVVPNQVIADFTTDDSDVIKESYNTYNANIPSGCLARQ